MSMTDYSASPGADDDAPALRAAAPALYRACRLARAWICGSSPSDLRYTALLEVWAALDGAIAQAEGAE